MFGKKLMLAFIPAITLIFLASCKGKAIYDAPLPLDSAYFSVKQFIRDQIQTNQGQPYTLTRISTLNGARDSMLIDITNLNWSSILNTFEATDIAERKFLDHYDFSVTDDEMTGKREWTYTAKDPKLFTRLLQIHSDPFNNRITAIYIETAKRDFFSSKSQKLLYLPMRLIQIQEAEHSLIGRSKDLRVELRFPEEPESDKF